ncbi:two-component system sensor histidine kinase DesK [Pseudonocardia alni]|uniref:Two-component system sensor histidine kinase DesK n=1 Tax=Pseudonocardia alni TaxID=33907 RepID=A0AA44URW3_PSEA5|nr:two-component system sensor histidine kinase DesK [Pseudonocardia alni]
MTDRPTGSPVTDSDAAAVTDVVVSGGADTGAAAGTAAARARRAAMLTALAAIAPLCVVGVVLTAHSWWEGLIVAVGLVLALGVLRQWSLDGYSRGAVFTLAFTGVNWLVAALSAASPITFVPFALIGSLLVSARPRHRRMWVGALAVVVAASGAAALLPRPPTVTLAGQYVLLPLLGTLFVAGVIVVSEYAWVVVRRLERAREAERELAVAHERMRFAGDLHDIHGHSLHVIKLKAAYAQGLVRGGGEDAAATAVAELGEIRGLVDDALTRTRELAHARHQLNLTAELENTRRLGEAAGITVEVHHDPGAAPAHPLLAQVLREATTNLLRHARPSTVRITTSATRVEITNDGVAPAADAGPELRGLARLRDRLAAAGGDLDVTTTPTTFTVAARLASPGAGTRGTGAARPTGGGGHGRR